MEMVIPNPTSVENLICNELLLKKIFSNCSLKTLKSIRLVSPQWYNVSKKYWHDKATLFLKLFEENGTNETIVLIGTSAQLLSQYLTTDNNLEHEQNSIRYFKQLNVSCLHKFEQVTSALPSSRSHPAQLSIFYKNYGQTLEEVRLNECVFQCQDELTKIILENMPNLKSLHLDKILFTSIPFSQACTSSLSTKKHACLTTLKIFILEDSFDWDMTSIPFCYEQLLQRLPTLEHLIVDTFASGPSQLVGRALKSIRQDDATACNLKTLNVGAHDCFGGMVKTEGVFLNSLTLELFTGFTQMENLWMSIENDMTELDLYNALKSFASNLQTLKLSRYQQQTPFQGFPFGLEFKFLKKLILTGGITNSFKLLQYMPALKKLKFKTRTCRCNILLPQLPEIIHNNLTKLGLGIGYVCNNEIITNLAKCVPNLTDLEMKVEHVGVTLDIVSRNWYLLRNIDIRGCLEKEIGLCHSHGMLLNSDAMERLKSLQTFAIWCRLPLELCLSPEFIVSLMDLTTVPNFLLTAFSNNFLAEELVAAVLDEVGRNHPNGFMDYHGGYLILVKS